MPNPAKDGAFVIGLSMEGARWDDANMTVDKARPKEMFVKMPCMTVRADTHIGGAAHREEHLKPIRVLPCT